MSTLFVRCSAADRDLGARVVAALQAAGHDVALPDFVTGSDVAPTSSALGVILVTRRWSQGHELAEIVRNLGASSTPALLVWWDEDAPSDFLGNGGRAQETVDVFYACFLPVHDRIPALVERLRDDVGAELP